MDLDTVWACDFGNLCSRNKWMFAKEAFPFWKSLRAFDESIVAIYLASTCYFSVVDSEPNNDIMTITVRFMYFFL